jgi:hypothetical protein
VKKLHLVFGIFKIGRVFDPYYNIPMEDST